MHHSSQPERFIQPDWSEMTVVATPPQAAGIPFQPFNKAEQNYPIYDRELQIIRASELETLMRNTTHPVGLLRPPNLLYYRELRTSARESTGYIVELADYTFRLGINQDTRTRPMNWLGDLYHGTRDENELVLVSPGYLCAHRNPHLRSTWRHVQNPNIMAPIWIRVGRKTILETSLTTCVTIAEVLKNLADDAATS